jgi:TonB family protein
MVLVATVPFHVRAADELEQHLRFQYIDKTLVLRNFYPGEQLSYDSGGLLTSRSAVSGDWTVDGIVRVTAINVSSVRLTIEGERLPLAVGAQGFDVQRGSGKKKIKKANRLRIVVDVDQGGINAEKAEVVLSKIFLTAQDRFVDVVPAYWKPCVSAASGGSERNKYTGCRFPPEFATIPGVVLSSQPVSDSERTSTAESKAPDGVMTRIEKGVTPPRVLFSQDPSFSEQARHAKYHGTVVLSITVDQLGQVRNIRVWKPLGLGLDQKAVEAISAWKFDPGRRNGQPVAVEIAVEVDFHLY